MKLGISGAQPRGERPNDNSLRADALRVVGAFFTVLVVTETILCLTLGLPNPLAVVASVLH